jgi:hypothetical protein
MAHEVAEVLHREQIFARGDGHVRRLAKNGMSEVVERLHRLLEPAEPIALHRPRVGKRRVEIEPAVGIDSQVLAGPSNLQRPFDALDVFRERDAPTFIFMRR